MINPNSPAFQKKESKSYQLKLIRNVICKYFFIESSQLMMQAKWFL